jgi:hypothetical protein
LPGSNFVELHLLHHLPGFRPCFVVGFAAAFFPLVLDLFVAVDFVRDEVPLPPDAFPRAVDFDPDLRDVDVPAVRGFLVESAGFSDVERADSGAFPPKAAWNPSAAPATAPTAATDKILPTVSLARSSNAFLLEERRLFAEFDFLFVDLALVVF